MAGLEKADLMGLPVYNVPWDIYRKSHQVSKPTTNGPFGIEIRRGEAAFSCLPLFGRLDFPSYTTVLSFHEPGEPALILVFDDAFRAEHKYFDMLRELRGIRGPWWLSFYKVGQGGSPLPGAVDLASAVIDNRIGKVVDLTFPSRFILREERGGRDEEALMDWHQGMTDHEAMIGEAREFARRSHRGQKRKYHDGDVDYFVHPERVAEEARRLGMTPQAVIAAYLHDVIEDTPVSPDEIRAKFGPEVADMVLCGWGRSTSTRPARWSGSASPGRTPRWSGCPI